MAGRALILADARRKIKNGQMVEATKQTSPKADNLVWIDMEMSGLDPAVHVILEVACIVTDPHLQTLDEMEPIAISQPQAELDKMDEWNRNTHAKTGLIERVRASDVSVVAAESAVLDFLQAWVEPEQAPICGNSIHQDRRFINQYMSRLDGFLHYRIVDVSSVKILAHLWRPEVVTSFKKKNTHSALADIRESIEELRHYRKHLFNLMP